MLPINVAVNVKPVFAQLIPSGPYEGPCRVGAKEDLSPEAESQRGWINTRPSPSHTDTRSPWVDRDGSGTGTSRYAILWISSIRN